MKFLLFFIIIYVVLSEETKQKHPPDYYWRNADSLMSQKKYQDAVNLYSEAIGFLLF